jgi:Tol biopolymer transport system component
VFTVPMKARLVAAVVALSILMALVACGGSPTLSSPSGSAPPSKSPRSTTAPTDPPLARVPGQLVFDHIDAEENVTLWAGTGAGAHALFPSLGVEHAQAAWSPDGKTLAFQELAAAGARIFVSNLGGTPRELATGCKAPECLEDGFPAFSPDGKRLAFSRILGSDKPLSSGIAIADASGANARVLTDVPWSRFADKSPRWSPDGQSIVFAREEHRDAGGDITGSSLYILTVATGELRRLTPPGLSAAAPDWAPSALIAFGNDVDQVSAGSRDVSVIAADGTGLRNVTAGSSVAGSAATPSWTPDGARLLFSHRTNTGYASIWIINADGTQAEPLTTVDGIDAYPALSPT